MKKQALIIIIAFLSFSSYAQIKFEKGYFINNAGEKTDCFIKNLDRYKNPTSFEYKTSIDSKSQILTISEVKEFGFIEGRKYKKETVMIDRSSNSLEELSLSKESEFKEETVFLRIMIEGEASLYSFIDNNLERYFYKINNSEISQLIYKKYKDPGSRIIKTNNGFREQLWTDLKCESITLNEVKKVEYNKNDLLRYFERFNVCKNSDFVNFIKRERNKSKGSFNLNIRPGLIFSSLNVEEGNPSVITLPTIRELDFDVQSNFRIGVEFEFILPFNKNKWAIIIEPNYQRNFSRTEGELTPVESFTAITTFPSRGISVEFSSFELPIGIRHYFFLNDHSKIFVNGGLTFNFPGNSEITVNSLSGNTTTQIDTDSGTLLSFGLGYNYRRFSLEMRYNTGTDILGESNTISSSYSSFSTILGYRLF